MKAGELYVFCGKAHRFVLQEGEKCLRFQDPLIVKAAGVLHEPSRKNDDGTSLELTASAFLKQLFEPACLGSRLNNGVAIW